MRFFVRLVGQTAWTAWMSAGGLALLLLWGAGCNSMRAPEAARTDSTASTPAAAVPALPAAPAAAASPQGQTASAKTAPPAAKPALSPATGAVANTSQALARAAQGFIDSLSKSERSGAQLPFASSHRERWHYVPGPRKGLALGDIDDAQRQAVHDLLQVGLSESGYKKVVGILQIEDILGAIEGNPGFRDSERYYLAVFGAPGKSAPWGWRFEGHHLSLNFTHVADRVATTPTFLGANPARVPSGRPHAGLRVLAAEEDQARALFRALNKNQRARALISSAAPHDIVTLASRRVQLGRFEGLPAADMTAAQRNALMALVEIYARNLRPALAQVHLDRIRQAGVESLYFAWAGSSRPRRAHYYRIHGPTHLIEYDNRGGNHIHTVFRDLENDFGDDLLAGHLQTHHGGASP